jgi:hypothetical protein
MRPARLIAARLSRDGYGSAIDLLNAPASVVLDMDEHSRFCGEYAEAYAQLNKGEK